MIKKIIQGLGIVKTTYIVIAALLAAVTLIMTIGFYFGVLEYDFNGRRVKVIAEATRLNIELKTLNWEDIGRADSGDKAAGIKVSALKTIIQPLFDEITKEFSDYSIGYYDLRFDSIVAMAPDFESSILQQVPGIAANSKSSESGNLELVENNGRVGWEHRGTITVSMPYSFNNRIIGRIWVTTKTNDIYRNVLMYSVSFLGFLLVLFFLPFTVTWFMIRKLREQLSSFAQSILEDGGVQIDTRIFPEFAPLLSAAEARSRQLRTYEDIVRNSNDSISTIDLDYKFTSINPAGQRVYGYTATEVLGQHISLLSVPEGLQTMIEDYQRIKLGEEVPTQDVQRQNKEGKVLDVSLSVSAIKDGHGNVIGIMGIARDITERKTMELEMKRLDGLNLIGQMAASIAHEIRNPMTTVRGFLQMLGSKPNLSDYNDYFQLMIEELDRANSIITEFLSLSRNNPITLSRGNLNNILNKLLPMLQADALGSEHTLVVELEEIPDVAINEQEMRQVILNLARNALESMPTGGVMTIETHLEKDQVVLTVADQGAGIPLEVLDNIGKPFLTTKETGTGLGLAVSNNIVNRHGGTMSIRTGDEGTTLTIKLPLGN